MDNSSYNRSKFGNFVSDIGQGFSGGKEKEINQKGITGGAIVSAYNPSSKVIKLMC